MRAIPAPRVDPGSLLTVPIYLLGSDVPAHFLDSVFCSLDFWFSESVLLVGFACSSIIKTDIRQKQPIGKE